MESDASRFSRVLHSDRRTKLIYCGWIPARGIDEPVKELHQPLINEELFNTVQAMLSGRKVSTVPKKRHNPFLPLKAFVRCGSCGNPITGGFATGKNKAKKYGFYWCYRPGCRALKVAKQELETAFIEHLRKLRPNSNTLAALPKAAAKMWAERQGDSDA